MKPRGVEYASARAKARAKADNSTYQPYHYEDAALLWNGDKARRPTADEWELLLGLPRRWTDVPGLVAKPDLKELARLKLLGNGWHNSCVKVLSHALCTHIHVEVDDAFPDALIVASVKPEDPQPAHLLFGLSGRPFVEQYIRCVPEPLQSIAL